MTLLLGDLQRAHAQADEQDGQHRAELHRHLRRIQGRDCDIQNGVHTRPQNSKYVFREEVIFKSLTMIRCRACLHGQAQSLFPSTLCDSQGVSPHAFPFVSPPSLLSFMNLPLTSSLMPSLRCSSVLKIPWNTIQPWLIFTTYGFTSTFNTR